MTKKISNGSSLLDPAFAAPAFAALGHEARLNIYRQLVKAGEDGLNIGDIGRLVGLPASTLSHHLGTLVQAGLVHQEKHGRETRNRADFDVMGKLAGFIADECCMGVDLADAMASSTRKNSENAA